MIRWADRTLGEAWDGDDPGDHFAATSTIERIIHGYKEQRLLRALRFVRTAGYYCGNLVELGATADSGAGAAPKTGEEFAR